jgi:hypothetical protein
MHLLQLNFFICKERIIDRTDDAKLLVHFLVKQSSISEICTFFVFFLASSIFDSVGLLTPLIPIKQEHSLRGSAG